MSNLAIFETAFALVAERNQAADAYRHAIGAAFRGEPDAWRFGMDDSSLADAAPRAAHIYNAVYPATRAQATPQDAVEHRAVCQRLSLSRKLSNRELAQLYAAHKDDEPELWRSVIAEVRKRGLRLD